MVSGPAHGSLILNADGSFTYTPNANYNGTDSFTYTVSDGIASDTATVNLNVTSVNDNPTARPDWAFPVLEDSVDNVITVLGNDSILPDTGETLTVTSVSALHGAVVTNPDGTLSYTPTASYFGDDTISYTIADGHGGTAASTVAVTVTNVNDAPDGADKTITMFEDGTYTLKVVDFGFSDTKDSPANTLTGVKITTLENAGALKLNGVDVSLNQVISAGDITAGKLTFKPATDANGAGYANFQFAVIDNGGTANGGVDTDATPNQITFDVTAVNDAPSGANKTITMLEDGTYTLKVADFGLSDTKDSPANTLAGVKITTLENAGALKLDGVDVYLNQVISAADIIAGKLTFKPATDANGGACSGYANFQFAVIDDGGTANGGVDTDATPNKITFNVTAVNDAPSGADKTITMLEDGTYTLKVADFGFSDTKDSPANSLTGVKITTLENAGALMWKNSSGVWKDVSLNQVISATDINAGKLTFKPASNANGSGYTNFQFAVIDNGGTANGGVDTDATPNKITFNVTAVNYAPAGANKTISVSNGGSYTIKVSDFGFSDSDGDALAAVKITTLENAGALEWWNGSAWIDVKLNQQVTAYDIGHDWLRYKASNVKADFQFAVIDTSGAIDLSPNKITFSNIIHC